MACHTVDACTLEKEAAETLHARWEPCIASAARRLSHVWQHLQDA